MVGLPVSGLPVRQLIRRQAHTVSQMPDVSCYSETTGSITGLGNISTYTLGESVVFEVPDGFGEEAGTDQEQDSG